MLEERNALVELRSSCWVTDLLVSFQDERSLYLAMEYIPGGSLASYMWSRGSPFHENEACFYAAQIVLALEYIHNKGYLHR